MRMHSGTVGGHQLAIPGFKIECVFKTTKECCSDEATAPSLARGSLGWEIRG